MSTRHDDLRSEICNVGRRLYERGLVAGHDGNISVRWTGDEVLCTPTRVCKGWMRPEQLCLVDPAGARLGGPLPPSSEIQMHLTILRHRSDVHAVVHAHPPHVLAFAATNTALPRAILPEVEVALGEVPIVPYVTPGTPQLGEALIPHLTGASALILANHGSVTFAESLEVALWLTEILDHYCHVILLSRPLGPLAALTTEQLGVLRGGR
ncbi:MAG TPA: class II aldolase/adducin family protein [Pirellulaceae bacterium]